MGTQENSNTAIKGKNKSIIEHFGIKKLYGYRNISLESKYAATIVIAKNGSGKTTLLGALNAFLRLQFSRLRNLDFDTIHCRLAGVDGELVLHHEEVIDFLQVPSGGEFAKLAARASIEPQKLFDFVLDEFPTLEMGSTEHRLSDIFRSIMTACNYDYKEAKAQCETIRTELYARSGNILHIVNSVGKALSDCEIVYLPTYRRIELSLPDEGGDSFSRRRRRQKLNFSTGGLFTGDIQFGLSDIAERLHELNNQIIFESNEGYRKISASIINDLLDGVIESGSKEDREIPTETELKIFFSRIQEGRKMGPYPPVAVPNIEKIYSGNDLPGDSSKFLAYFLEKLSTVISASRAVEAPVDGFIASCNKYLMSSDLSSGISGNRMMRPGSTGKELKLNRRNLRVRVLSVPERRRISLDALSSGEKQMISLFARLYLYPSKKIILIDEPELSLSLDWQTQILVDVLNSPLCEQVVAITHSPFIFDNELEPFAKSLSVSSEPYVSRYLPGFDEDDEFDG